MPADRSAGERAPLAGARPGVGCRAVGDEKPTTRRWPWPLVLAFVVWMTLVVGTIALELTTSRRGPPGIVVVPLAVALVLVNRSDRLDERSKLLRSSVVVGTGIAYELLQLIVLLGAP